MLIDHLVYAVPDLTAAVADLAERFGVEAAAALVARLSGPNGRAVLR